MQISLMSFTGYTLGAINGNIGTVKELYFDDETWTIRYMVVETGNWLTGRTVLISTQALERPDWDNEVFQTNLTLDQIKNSPDIDTNKPVSRQQEKELYNHFPWHIYWGPGTGSQGGLMPLTESVKLALEEERERKGLSPDPHLRSTKTITGYDIHATDGQVGKVVDFVVDTDNWKIVHMIVDTGSWLSANEVLLSLNWVKEINWSNKTVIVGVGVEEVKTSPQYDPHTPVNEVYEKNLRDYYGRLISQKKVHKDSF